MIAYRLKGPQQIIFVVCHGDVSKDELLGNLVSEWSFLPDADAALSGFPGGESGLKEILTVMDILAGDTESIPLCVGLPWAKRIVGITCKGWG